MDIFELTTNPKIKDLVKKQKQVEGRKAQAGYNLFTISSYNSYLENFHSDIIASLLDPDALHNEKSTFLYLFIDYLNKVFKTNIDTKLYLNAKVLREKGRIDIWVFDEISRHSFFIENKINGAIDQNNQVEDYYYYVLKNNYSVDSIVYITKDKGKTAPLTKNVDINKLEVNPAAFNNSPTDLYTGWLKPCFNACTNEDSKSFIHQYSKLISHLSNKNMCNNMKKEFYDFLNENKALDAVLEIQELYPLLPVYRAECFRDNTEDYAPFGHKFKFQNNYYIFENYIDSKGSYKLDVFFNLDGSASVVMWNTIKSGQEGYNTVKELLTRVGLIDQFKAPSKFNGLHSEFIISERYPTMGEVDKEVLNLVKSVFEKLK